VPPASNTHNHSAQKQERAAAAITAGVITGVGAMMANPLVAEAAVTPSLKCVWRGDGGRVARGGGHAHG